MSTYTHRQIEDLLGAFAVDAVDGDERDLVEAHLLGCPRCRSEVAAHRETVVLLASSGEAAPDRVWSRIAEALDEAPPELDMARIIPFAPVPQTPADQPRRPRRTITVPVAAGLAAVAAAVFAFLGVQIGRDDTGQQAAAPTASLSEAMVAALADPGAEDVRLESADGQRGARVVRLADGSGYVAAENLGGLPSGRTYQLWGLREGGMSISLGVLGADPKVASFKMVGDLAGFAITDEASPGANAPSGAPLVAGYIEDQPA